MRLAIQYSPGFSRDLWGWKLRVAPAPSGRVEVVWETKTSEPRKTHEHRFRARSLPDWWPALSAALDAVDFGLLPPTTPWRAGLDDAPMLFIERREADVVRNCSIFYAPKLWPELPLATHRALQTVVSLLDPLARALHTSRDT